MIVVLGLLCVGIIAVCVQDIARELRAPRLAAAADAAAPPLVSVIIPARNEAARIGACLAGLAAQHGRVFEVLVVDDDSSDDTAMIARSYAGQMPALHVLAGTPLPPDWAGKCWACWQAAQQAQGAWLLFLDADVIPQPGLIDALVAHAQRSRAAMITLMPLLQLGSFAERLVLPAFHSILYGLYPLQRVSDSRSLIAFANGQCIFIRRDVYDAVDGHRAVQNEVLEDAIFGQRVKASGVPVAALSARDLLQVRMYTGWSSLAEGLSKHAVAGMRNGGARAVGVGVRQALLGFGPLYLLGTGAALLATQPNAARALLLCGALLLLLTLGTYGWLYRRRYRIAPWWGMLYPLGLAAYFGLSGWAFVRAARGQGVAWKGRVLRG